MSTGSDLSYISVQGHLQGHLPIPLVADGGLYRKAHTVRPTKPSGLDWAALTPRCRKCGEQSGQLDRKTRCPQCRPNQPKVPPTPTRVAAVKRRTPTPGTRRTNQAEIVEAYQANMALEEIKTRFRVGTITLRRIITEAGIPPRTPLPPIRKDHTPRQARVIAVVDEAQVVTDYHAGQSVYQIAQANGVRPKRIYTILNNHHIPRRDDRSTNSGSKRKTYEPAFVARVKELYESGLTQHQTALVMGVSEKVVWRCITNTPSLTPRPSASVLSMQGHGREQKLPKADQPSIIARYQAGETGPAIAASYGCSAASIYALLDKHDIPRRHTGNRPTPNQGATP